MKVVLQPCQQLDVQTYFLYYIWPMLIPVCIDIKVLYPLRIYLSVDRHIHWTHDLFYITRSLCLQVMILKNVKVYHAWKREQETYHMSSLQLPTDIHHTSNIWYSEGMLTILDPKWEHCGGQAATIWEHYNLLTHLMMTKSFIVMESEKFNIINEHTLDKQTRASPECYVCCEVQMQVLHKGMPYTYFPLVLEPK